MARSLQKASASTEAQPAAPAVGQPWPGIAGSVYAGISRGENGEPDGHLILLAAVPATKLAWADAAKWAANLGDGARLPTRFESALLYANVQDKIDTSGWYWTGTQYSSGNAWGQYFYYGGQSNYGKNFEARCRAVRRLPLQSFNPSMEVGPRADGTVQALLQELVSEVKGARADVQKIFLADTEAVS